MKLVMTLLVRDEEDILDANLRFHLDRGVDLVLVTDNGSVDGTADTEPFFPLATAAKLFSAARMVRSITSSVCAKPTKNASYWLGGRKTPFSSIEWKKRA